MMVKSFTGRSGRSTIGSALLALRCVADGTGSGCGADVRLACDGFGSARWVLRDLLLLARGARSELLLDRDESLVRGRVLVFLLSRAPFPFFRYRARVVGGGISGTYELFTALHGEIVVARGWTLVCG